MAGILDQQPAGQRHDDLAGEGDGRALHGHEEYDAGPTYGVVNGVGCVQQRVFNAEQLWSDLPTLPGSAASIAPAAAWANATVDSVVLAANDAGKVDVGKLPNELLARLLARVRQRDPRVVLGPAPHLAQLPNQAGKRLVESRTPLVTTSKSPAPSGPQRRQARGARD